MAINLGNMSNFGDSKGQILNLEKNSILDLTKKNL